MDNSYLGGIQVRGAGETRRSDPSRALVGEDWSWAGEGTELFLRGAPQCSRVFTWDSFVLLIRGYARPRGCSAPLDLERLAEELRCHYLEQGVLAVDDLDGSFTVALLDGHVGRVILYRNLVGAGFTYYHPHAGGLLFGSNLADLVQASRTQPRANSTILPAYFLYRCVPGSETLFEDYFRLLPGEQLTWDAGELTSHQRHTFADLAHTHAINPTSVVEDLDQTMTAVLEDCAALRPAAANLLSGGVDSSYLQAIWNQVVSGPSMPRSFSVSVDHPHTWMDTDYALTASQALGCRHTLIPAGEAYAEYLLDALTSTGEPLNHVQSAYFGHLARAMAAEGVTAGLCGEGADSLFGVGMANHVHNAQVVRRLLPFSALRQLGNLLGSLAGAGRLAYTCRVADRLDDFSWLEHPVNTVASFTETGLVRKCFGRTGWRAGAAGRRSLLDRFNVPLDSMDRLHATGFLGEAMDSAGLWTTLFNRAGADLLCPFLDTRLLRFALSLPAELRFPFRKPKELLKRTLARHAPDSIARRVKLGFGQPIFEWLAPGGQLRPLVDTIGKHDFLDPTVLAQARRQPGWFLYSLLCYDLWHKVFIQRAIPQPETWQIGAAARTAA